MQEEKHELRTHPMSSHGPVSTAAGMGRAVPSTPTQIKETINILYWGQNRSKFLNFLGIIVRGKWRTPRSLALKHYLKGNSGFTSLFF